MPLNARITTASYEGARLDKPRARSFTVQVGNQSVYYQVNAPPFGTGENWVPGEGNILFPGFWTFGPEDWAEYGVVNVQGIRFKAVDIATPGIVTVS